MFKRDVKPLGDLLQTFLRNEGLETPLKQKRLLDAWEGVAGAAIARYTGERFIKNQTLFVKGLEHDAAASGATTQCSCRWFHHQRHPFLLTTSVPAFHHADANDGSNARAEYGMPCKPTHGLLYNR